MKQIYFGVVTILLLLMQHNMVFGQQAFHHSNSDFNSFSFIENKGQIRDQNKNPRSNIDFVLHGNGLNIFIGPGFIHYQFNKNTASHNKEQNPQKLWSDRFSLPSSQNENTDQVYELYRLEMNLSGANVYTKAVPEMPLPAKYNYYLPGCGAEGLTNLSSFQRIVYPEIYPGIDWVIYIKDRKLKYDFILHDGASSASIAMEYKGATNQVLHNDGSIEISTPLGSVKEEAPVAWTKEGHKNTGIKFKRQQETWGFDIEPWKGTLVLDPGLSWSTYYGGSGMDISKDVHTHNSAVYVTGLTTSLSQIATTGTYQTNYYGGIDGDAFIAKFTAEGSLLWATYYGGDSNDLGWSIVTDLSGNAYVTGYTQSSIGIATPGSHQPNFAYGTTDAFLAKFSSSGQRIWSTYYGGASDDYGHSIAIDGNYLYTCGSTYSSTGIATPGSYQPTLTTYAGNTGNGFLAKWDLDGNRLWGTYYGAGTTTASSVTVDQNHNVYLAGGTNAAANVSTAGSHQSVFAGLYDNFVAKFNSAGQRQWSTYFGGSAVESSFPIVLATDDNKIYLAGITYSYDQIATAGTSRSSYSNGIDGYLASFTPAGVQEWGTYVGPGNMTNGVYVSDIAVGNCGDIYLTGDIYPSVGLSPSEDAYQQMPGGGTYDGALIRYTPDGKSNYCSYIGGSMEDNMSALAVSDDGNLYLAGITLSNAGIVDNGTHQSSFGGVKDVFLMKFQDVIPGDKENPNSIYDSVHCINDTFPIDYTPTASFQTGNIFSAELSDNTGSFQNAIVIGTHAGTGGGIINCSVPQTVAPGGGYRLRITGSAPATKGTCSMPIWLNLPPIPEITVHGDTLISSTAINYQWLKNGSAINGATNQRYLTNSGGWYQVRVTDPVTGCKSYSDSVAIGNVGIDDVTDIKSLIDVFPNPTTGIITINIASSLANMQNYQLAVSTPLGKTIMVLPDVQHKNKIDLTAFAGGIYFIEVRSPAGKGVFKIVKR